MHGDLGGFYISFWLAHVIRTFTAIRTAPRRLYDGWEGSDGSVF